MPAAIPAIVAYGASAIAVEAGATAFTAALIGAAASVVAGAVVASALRPDTPVGPGNSLSAAGGGRTQQVRQPISPHRVIAGRIKVSGPILFIHSAVDDEARENGYIYIIHALAGHQCRAISDVFLDENLSTDARYSGLVTVNLHTGEDTQVADSLFTSEISSVWTSDHRLRGITYLASRLKFDANAFPGGLPNISAVVEGTAEITDFRDDVVRYSNNPALFIAWWMMSPLGMNLDETDLDLDSVIAAANVCDERVRVLSDSDSSPGAADTTATVDDGSPDTNSLLLADGSRDLDFGYGIRVANNLPSGLSADTTYYVIPVAHNQIQLATTHINALDKIPISIGDPAGTISIFYWDEPKYLINGEFTVDQNRVDILQGMLSTMAGVAVYIGGKWFIHAGAPATPTITLSEDDLRAAMTMVPKRSMRDRFNAVRAVYVNPDASWQPVDAPPLIDTSEARNTIPVSYTVTVGAGGDGQDGIGLGESGEDSVFDSITAAGGGGAGDFSDTSVHTGADGGSGGGGGTDSTAPFTARDGGAGDTPDTTPDQGNDGGDGVTGGSASGGGGGANAAGANGSGSTGGAGGAGKASSITGSSVTRGGGGGGGANTTGGAGGAGGGGAGAAGAATGGSGTANTGGGAGGASSGIPGDGGSGVVILRYLTGDFTATGGTMTTDGAYTIHTFNASSTFTVTAGAGNVWYLVIGGGGGGSFGGGGAGGYRTNDAYDYPVSAASEEVLYRDLRFPFTTSGRAVQRLMRIELERNLRERTVDFPAKLTAMRLLPWDGVYLDHTRYGFSAEQHRVIGWKLAEDGGVDLTLQADDADVYDWDRLTDEQIIAPSQEVTVPDGSMSAPVVLVAGSPIVEPQVYWQAVIGANQYDTEWRAQGDTEWNFLSRINNIYFIFSNFPVPVDFRVRSVSASGATSDYTENLAPQLPTDLVFVGPNITWTNAVDAEQVQIFKNTIEDVLGTATLLDTVDGDLETYTLSENGYYWIASVSATGNISAATDSIHVISF